MSRKRSLKGLEQDEIEFIEDKMKYTASPGVDYVSRGKGLDYKLYIRPKNERQKELIDLMKEKEVVFCSGAAGTGKSYVAFATVLSLLKEDNAFKHITLIVPTVQSDLEIGFLKGTLEDKIGPHAEPHLYTMEKIIDKSGGVGKVAVEALRKYGLLEIKPVSFLRGATLDNRIIVIEESQNLPISAFKTILTRLGDSCKMVFLGDIDQIDNKELKKKGSKSGLEHAIENLESIPEVGVIKFSKDEIVRNPLISKILEKWD